MDSKPAASQPHDAGRASGPQGEAAAAFGSTAGSLWRALAGVSLPLPTLARVQADYLREAGALWNDAVAHQARGASSAVARPVAADRRFAAADWTANPTASFVAQLYLLNSKALTQLADAVEGDDKSRKRIRFGVQQWIDAAAPCNYLALNPEAQRKALETRGASLSQGLRQLWNDVHKGHVSQTDEAVFEVGRNVAATEGSVVFENDFFQLLEYKPLTAEVHERPLLMVPPCINKFYILDMQPDNSFVRHAVAQGQRVFVMSWRNPDASLARATWDDYAEQGVIRAIDAVLDITGQDRAAGKLNVLGFCVGGTLLSTALAVLAARGRQPAASLTLLTTFLDFSDTGVMDVFIDERSVRRREETLGAQSPSGGGLLKGRELATTFNFLRPNELVWNYVVGNYLKGEAPPPFDMLYWNADSANLPGPMYAWYLRNTYLENNLMKPGKVSLCGVPVDLGSFEAPVYLYASREDHIVPWEGAYRSTQVLAGPKRFVLGASGHIAGVINPPSKNKRCYWTAADASPDAAAAGRRRKAGAKSAVAPLPARPEAWLDGAEEHPGSWWPDWIGWLQGHAGATVPAPAAPGSAAYPPIEPAPGRYVKVKA